MKKLLIFITYFICLNSINIAAQESIEDLIKNSNFYALIDHQGLKKGLTEEQADKYEKLAQDVSEKMKVELNSNRPLKAQMIWGTFGILGLLGSIYFFQQHSIFNTLNYDALSIAALSLSIYAFHNAYFHKKDNYKTAKAVEALISDAEIIDEKNSD